MVRGDTDVVGDKEFVLFWFGECNSFDRRAVDSGDMATKFLLITIRGETERRNSNSLPYELWWWWWFRPELLLLLFALVNLFWLANLENGNEISTSDIIHTVSILHTKHTRHVARALSFFGLSDDAEQTQSKNSLENSLWTDLRRKLHGRTHNKHWFTGNVERTKSWYNRIQIVLILFSSASFFLSWNEQNASEHLEITIRTVCVALSKLLTPKH